ncbi:SOS response-associated peptidase family protein [Caulobacter sp. Root343]|uniref:SOS response-associated peptidase family protein n=1 Tax=Caulobacter sp. Root343 TaxID=1736520 RepID=UPI0006FB0F0B|nr:SOS response-associated peptidase family protein [Caulobacter sp. Root343]KQV66670.1 hypothetical protein ASC70_12620 [Caulobacter sp. Root343]
MCNIEELYYDIFGWAQAHEDLLKKSLTLPRGTRIQEANIDLSYKQFTYPNYSKPTVRLSEDGGHEIHFARWGMPSSGKRMMELVKKRTARLDEKGVAYDFKTLLREEPDPGVTNVRDLDNAHWRRWQGVENRCLVPITAFCEPDQDFERTGKPIWFAEVGERRLAYFAGIWTPHACVKTKKAGWEEMEVYAFLTTDANDVVRPYHKKAMPVFLRTPEEIDTWLRAPWEEARGLQRSLPSDELQLIDPPPARAAA